MRYLLAFISIISFSVLADTKAEIDHLISYVKNTNCMYERNGDKHKGSKAAKHIVKKYRYFEDDIKSAEDFIKLSATKSTMSGKYYQIHCPNQPVIKSQDWLLAELNRLRAKS